MRSGWRRRLVAERPRLRQGTHQRRERSRLAGRRPEVLCERQPDHPAACADVTPPTAASHEARGHSRARRGPARARGRVEATVCRSRVAWRCGWRVDGSRPRGRARVFLVSATNGKTSTTAVLPATLRGTVSIMAHNTSGANLMPGLVRRWRPLPMPPTRCSRPTKVRSCRRRPTRSRCDHPRRAGRDQLDRYREVGRAGHALQRALAGTRATVVAVADDPNVGVERGRRRRRALGRHQRPGAP